MPLLDLFRLPRRPTTRFAPSPTGLLHLGHVANAVWTWGVAQATDGRVLLRIEDHDRGRCRAEYERLILEDLSWLGLEPEPATLDSLRSGEPSPWRQSDCGARYGAALEQLRRATAVYACRCSRKTIARDLGLDRPPELSELRYPGTCRHLDLAEGAGLGLRAVLPAAAIRYDDLRHGPRTEVPRDQCGDLLLRDPNGNWTYQFAVTVDDLSEGVDLVIRGDDLLESTGRQILLSRLLGRETPPRFLHHPLIYGAEPGVKLSKRDRVAGVASLREAGRLPTEVLGEAAYRTGLLDRPLPVAAAELGRLFQP